MKYYLGIDGGGTKTAYLLTDENGTFLAQLQTEGCSYPELGPKRMIERLMTGAESCLKKAGISLEMLSAAGIGLPGLGENRAMDVRITETLKEKFAGVSICCVNDVEAGWAGSLGMEPGIHLVSGTGSIAFGRNKAGNSQRSGGWSAFFGDEGSCCWLGRRTMELFSKQADGRVPKGPLYHLVRDRFQLEQDMDFIAYMEKEYIPVRSKTASLQKLLLAAADQGDEGARSLYREAAEELGMMAKSIAFGIFAGEKVVVSYSGGLFHGREFVLPVLEERIAPWNGILAEPLFSPVQGAALLGAFQDGKEQMERMKSHWKHSENGQARQTEEA